MALVENKIPQLMVPLSGCELYARPCLRGAALERVPKFANISQIWLKYRNLANFGRFVSRRSRKRMHSRQLCTEARASSFCSFWLKHMAWFLLQSEHFYFCNGFLPSCSWSVILTVNKTNSAKFPNARKCAKTAFSRPHVLGTPTSPAGQKQRI